MLYKEYISKVIKEFIFITNFFFSTSKKIKLSLLFFFSLFIILLETYTLSLVYTASNSILDDNFEFNNSILNYIFSNFSIEEGKLALVSILTLLSFIFIKNIFQIFIIIFKNNFFLNMHTEISKKIYKKYLFQNYSFFVNKNSSELISSVVQDVGLVMRGFEAIFNIVVESILILIIFIYLVNLDSNVAIIFLIGSIIFFIFHMFFTKKKLISLSKQRLVLNEEIVRGLQQSFVSFREIIIYSISKLFSDSINLKFKQFFSNIKITSILQQTTRVAIEQVFIILIILIFLFINYATSKNLIEIIPIFAVYLFAFLKILPSLNKLIIETQSYVYSKLFIVKLNSIYKLKERKILLHKPKKNIFNSEISFNEVKFAYNSKSIFENLNFKISKNDKIGILGESGSGKTTFLNLLMGLLDANKGEILIDNKKLDLIKLEWQHLIGYVPQNVALLDDNLKKNITFQNKDEFIDFDLLKESIEIAGLKDLVDKQSEGLNFNIGERGSKISAGEILRIGIARAIYSKPEIFIFDEFTSSLDEETENYILDSIKSINKTFIIVSHKKNTLKICNKVFNLQNKQFHEI